ncbi:DNA-binding protein WhiA [Christensenella intestinihominis]|uniref:DNA-binding protein WhiA n=1 Tax=Christensenella intestinihominis TaxID=1851429 RepID=UPI00083268CB|nr:DNA-binding protein WhiA [Christensenella intestinihominis]
MSFSMAAKDEICTQAEEKGCCIVAELCAITLICGNLSITSGGVRIKYNTENMAVAKRIYDTVTRILKLDSEVEIKDNLLKKKHSYTIVVTDAALLLSVLGLEGNLLTDAVPPREMLEKECCRAAILRGAFLGGGTVSNPKKNYHAEFVTNSEAFAQVLLSILEKNEIRAKIIHRRQNFVVYLNEGDGIAALLAMIGAYSSILNFENVRVLKEMRNNVNRAVNCDTANINKTVNAATVQVMNIHKIERTIGLKHLSDPLREAAELRLANPEATLGELCELCGTTKSGMNHRLRKINAIAQELHEASPRPTDTKQQREDLK